MNPPNYTSGGYINFNEEHNIEMNIYHQKYNLDGDQALAMMFTSNYFKGFLWNKIFDVSIIKKYGLRLDPGVKYCEDLLFTTQYLAHCVRVYYLSEPFYHYRIHGNNATEHGNPAVTVTGIDAYVKICSIMKKNLVSEDIICLAKEGIPYTAIKTMADMAYRNVYDNATALKSFNYFRDYAQFYHKHGIEPRLIKLIFKVKPTLVYRYFKLKTAIKKLLRPME